MSLAIPCPTAGYPASYFHKQTISQSTQIEHKAGSDNRFLATSPAQATATPTAVETISKEKTVLKTSPLINHKSHGAKEKVTSTLSPLATAFKSTVGVISYRPTVISGKTIEIDTARRAAKHLMMDVPISQHAIVFEHGKKPRSVTAYPNVIVL